MNRIKMIGLDLDGTLLTDKKEFTERSKRALRAAIDPIPFGRQAMEEDRGCFTKYGYLSLSGDEWQHEQAAEHGRREAEKKPSIRERLEQSKKECAGKDRAQPVKDKSAPEL